VRNYRTGQLTRNPERESVWGSFVLASIRKGLRAVRRGAGVRRERDRAPGNHPPARSGRPSAENSQTLARKYPSQLTIRLGSSPEHNGFINPLEKQPRWVHFSVHVKPACGRPGSGVGRLRFDGLTVKCICPGLKGIPALFVILGGRTITPRNVYEACRL